MLRKIDLKTLNENVFTLIGEDWMLITAGTRERCNTMTASWGGLGVLWNEPAATVYLRPQRYTKQFMDEQAYFTLSFFSPEYRRQLALCGSKSGRDTDKIRECGFTVGYGEGDAPYIEQARLVLVCRKRYAQEMDAASVPEDVRQALYAAGDYHTIYVGQIVAAYAQEKE